ncbi:MAG TPA: hypothetical protein VFX97_17195 [Pyrinomonadaceae bacterium]|nr:hypothetical protein [Pyrinomonadaceae bacterium]
MKKLTVILCLALWATTLAPVMSAGTSGRSERVAAQDPSVFTHQEAGVRFQLPKGWKAKPDGEVITASSADDALQVVFWIPDEANFEAAVKELGTELGKTIKNIKTVGKPSEDVLNDMPHYGETGTGEVDGTTIVWSVDVLGAKKPLIILTFAAPSLFEKHSSAYEQLLVSIKKI